MHGRVRVKRPDELVAQIEEEKKKKAQLYKSITNRIWEKRKNEEYDEEIMKLTRDILSKQPDVTTLWNIRKEALLQLKNTLDKENLENVIKDELKLTELSLAENPKSYSTWYYRSWILEKIAPAPNWTRELALTANFLKLDERNFHCWDYRYFVLSRLNVSYDEELKFITEKINENISNYSAWHYRSKLIPLVFPDPQKKRLFHQSKLRDELNLIENAIYTDPTDQSAWFYEDWIISSYVVPLKIVQAGYLREFQLVWVSFSREIAVDDNYTIKGLGECEWSISINNVHGASAGKYRIPSSSDKSSYVWVKTVNVDQLDDNQRSIILYNQDMEIDRIYLTENYYREPIFQPDLSEEDKQELEFFLKSCEQLLKMEPDNRLTMLSINTLSEKLGKSIDFSLLETLKSTDTLRKNYYNDLISKFKLEEKLSNVKDWNNDTFNIANMSITWLHHDNYFTLFQEIDLSNNPLGDTILPKLKYLFCCKALNLSNCGITDLTRFEPLKRLESLNLSDNRIKNSLSTGLINCTAIKSINMTNTSIDTNSSLYFSIIEKFPGINFIL